MGQADDDESLAAWVAKNVANHQRRAILVAEEGKLLALLAELAKRQEAADASVKYAEKAAEAAGYDEQSADAVFQALDRSVVLSVDMEMALLDRLCPNQDEQQRLLEELMEELTAEQVAEAERNDREVAREEEDAMPRRGRLRLVENKAHQERDERARNP